MEMLEEKIKEFLSNGDGYGNGNGYGYGYGYGNGDGNGCGYGYGSGCGYGDGCGYGYGYGSGCGYGYGSGCGYGNGSGYGDGNGYRNGYKDVSKYNGHRVHKIDGLPTIITFIKNDFAKGFVFNRDMTLMPCYVAKFEGAFAHGKTIKEAYEALQEKLLENMPVKERIEKFLKEFKIGVKYPNKKFFEWHHILTGSCLFGRQQFCENRGIDLDGEMTVERFIELTQNDYGGEVIRKLKESYSNG